MNSHKTVAQPGLRKHNFRDKDFVFKGAEYTHFSANALNKAGITKVMYGIDAVDLVDFLRQWSAVSPKERKEKISIVDCRNFNVDDTEQIKNSFHISIVDPSGQSVIYMMAHVKKQFDKFLMDRPDALQALLSSTYIVFYCSAASLRSPRCLLEYTTWAQEWERDNPGRELPPGCLLREGIESFRRQAVCTAYIEPAKLHPSESGPQVLKKREGSGKLPQHD